MADGPAVRHCLAYQLLLPAFAEGLAVYFVEPSDLGAFEPGLSIDGAEPVGSLRLISLLNGVEGHDTQCCRIQWVPNQGLADLGNAFLTSIYADQCYA